MAGLLENKVAIVTGGCSGIGLATVELFAAEGARVLVADLQADKGAAIEARLGDRVRFRRCDVTQEADIAAIVDAAVQAFGGLDVMFNNAGAGGTRLRIDEMTGDEWDRTQALLLRSVALGIRYAAPAMRARGGGAIVNTASVAALQAGAAPIAYSAAKAGVLHLSKVAAAELARDRIRVNAICPGLILTSIFSSALGLDADAAAQVDKAMASFAPQVQPLPMPGRPEEVAKVALFLASDLSAFVTGTHVVVDGGLTIGPRSSWDPSVPGPIEALVGAATTASGAS